MGYAQKKTVQAAEKVVESCSSSRQGHRSLPTQRLILRSYGARVLEIRQVIQLNAVKKTAGVDGKASLTFTERLALEQQLHAQASTWKANKLRNVPIPKKNGGTRMLKVPTIGDRSWQCLAKYPIEPAHEANFNANSYGFRPGRSAHDAQRQLVQPPEQQGQRQGKADTGARH